MSQTSTTPQVTGKMFLYERPVLLNPEEHGALGIKALDRAFDFCAKIRAAPITISEVSVASKNYPIIFASVEQPMPLAVLGLVDDVNLFVDEDGKWEQYAYIPGYIRRYPFGVARDEQSDRYAIVLDAGFEGLSADAEGKLFENGEASQFTKDAIEFSRNYEDDRRMTDRFVELLKKFDLLAPQTAQYTPSTGGDPVTFAQYVGFEEKRLQEMNDADFLEVRKAGILPILYAQLLSMTNWRLLMNKRANRLNLTEDQLLTSGAGA
ncbi:MAG: hypothetical protein GC152_02710 [Alphaproteobacteria bacterium]|nr:hypothetical protein [Alphaproteobacteria bacterium]